MTARALRRLPGVRFEVAAPALPEELPRMDVAAFVGFAASGPLDVPVPVEDLAQFHDIFGHDAAIAWDSGKGRTLYASLAASVRAFFRSGGQRCWVVRVARRATDPGGSAQAARANTFRIPGLFRYRPRHTVALEPASAVARSEGSWSDALRVATALESSALPVLGQDLRNGSLVLGVTSATDVVVGDLLRVSFVADERVVYLPVDSLRVVPVPSPLSKVRALSRTAVQVTSAGPLWVAPPLDEGAVVTDTAPASLPQVRACELLSFELLWRWGNGQPSRLSALGFCPAHPRFWGALPGDVELFASREDEPTTDLHALLRQAAAAPRVPLAGPEGSDAVYLPLGVEPLPRVWSNSDADPDDSLQRDGLATFDAGLFFDSELAETNVEALAAQADYLRYQSPTRRRLRGIHALYGVDEATLIAVPDAALRRWSPPVFDAPLAPAPQDPAPPRPRGPCLEAAEPDPTFSACDVRAPATPTLSAPLQADAGGSYSLSWSALDGAQYTLEESADPAFEGALVAYLGRATSRDFWGRSPGTYYYRVRARVAGLLGAWSVGRVVVVPPPARFQLQSLEDYRPDALLSVQRALLRLCAARGDLFAALATPEHYLEREAIEHSEQLRSALETTSLVPAIGLGESLCLSYGALYYPWLIGREESRPDELRSSPPDGAALGLIARRSIARGAWVAPANEPLVGVVALAQRVDPAQFSALYDARVNVFRHEPRGFLALSADTLSPDEELLPIHVRRLLSLVRRAALRLGQSHVFEPNDDTFRRLVERSFESLLGRMYARGAFSGASADKAFQVVTGPSLNTPSSVEQGRFFVELRVAPSQALSFITIRLLQSGDRSRVTEER